MKITELAVNKAWQPGNEVVFEQVFKENFKGLVAYAYTIVKNHDQAEEIVQQVFFKIWQKRESVQIKVSASAYLYKAIYNDCMNYLKHEKVKTAHEKHAMHSPQEQGENATERLKLRELEERLSSAISDLPDQCRTIFQLSRFQDLKYRQIASVLSISEKTVENQMGKALKLLRNSLSDYLPLILITLMPH